MRVKSLPKPQGQTRGRHHIPVEGTIRCHILQTLHTMNTWILHVCTLQEHHWQGTWWTPHMDTAHHGYQLLAPHTRYHTSRTHRHCTLQPHLVYLGLSFPFVRELFSYEQDLLCSWLSSVMGLLQLLWWMSPSEAWIVLVANLGPACEHPPPSPHIPHPPHGAIIRV